VSDIRFIMIGVGLVFAGFLVLGVFGENYRIANIESSEFGDCYQYFEDSPPVPANCAFKILESSLFFALVLSLIGGGIIALIKGYRGKWDNEVKPEEMLGPGGDQNFKDKDSEEKD